jgi:hypothetical protein
MQQDRAATSCGRKWRGNLVGVDVPRVLRLVAEARDGVVRRSGFMVDLLG